VLYELSARCILPAVKVPKAESSGTTLWGTFFDTYATLHYIALLCRAARSMHKQPFVAHTRFSYRSHRGQRNRSAAG
jgi:hypothetical protein